MQLSPYVFKRHQRAKHELWAGLLIGILWMILGLAVLAQQPSGWRVWLIPLSIFGLALVFLSIIGYFSYLEKIEDEHYLPHGARPETPPGTPHP